MRVVWDDSKNRRNIKKHGISFQEASTLFERAADYFEIFDEAHSEDEDRFIAIGPIASGLILVVNTQREEETIRIISARWATKREVSMYRSRLKGRMHG